MCPHEHARNNNVGSADSDNCLNDVFTDKILPEILQTGEENSVGPRKTTLVTFHVMEAFGSPHW